MRETTESQYGTYETTVIGLGSYQKHRCEFDDELESNTEKQNGVCVTEADSVNWISPFVPQSFTIQILKEILHY